MLDAARYCVGGDISRNIDIGCLWLPDFVALLIQLASRRARFRRYTPRALLSVNISLMFGDGRLLEKRRRLTLGRI